MNELLQTIIQDALLQNVSDIHFILSEKLHIHFRLLNGIQEVKYPCDEKLFSYLKFISNLDVSGHHQSQSGSFQLEIKHQIYHFRFSYIQHLTNQSGVLRILNHHRYLTIDDLSIERQVTKIFRKWTKQRVGFNLFSGPTCSGKTTTLHVILETIAKQQQLKIVTLEDPIEIYSSSYLQMQINEKANFTYDEAIKHLLRQDPDVIVIGEIRDEYTAKMAFRAALSGHMVFSTIHAKSASEALKRFIEFGISKLDIENTLTGITNQRLFKRKGKNQRICVYEVMEEEQVRACLKNQIHDETIQYKIKKYYEKGFIKKEDAQKEIEIN